MAAVTSRTNQQLSLKQVQRSKSNCRIHFNVQAAYRRAGKVDAQLFLLYAFPFSVASRTTSSNMCFMLLRCSKWIRGRAATVYPRIPAFRRTNLDPVSCAIS